MAIENTLVKINLIYALTVTYIIYYLKNRIPRIYLILFVPFLAYLGNQYIVFWYELKPFIKPSIEALSNQHPDSRLLIFCWSYALLFTAMCLQIKSVAFSAAFHLYRKFRVKLTH